MAALFDFCSGNAPRGARLVLLRLTAIIAIFCGACVTARATPPPGYYLVWGDEFNGASLDTNKWTYWVPGAFGDAYNVTNAVTMNGSNVVITTYTAGGTNYTALLASQNHFHPRYGYYEANIQWSDTNGEWSAFWLRSPTMGTYLDNTFASGGELDVCEHRYVGIYGTYIGNIISANIHWDGYGPAEKGSGSPNVGSNLQTGFHTYGLLWGAQTYQFQIDGSQVWDGSSVTPSFGSDAYVILSSQVDDTLKAWAGYIPTNGYGSQAQSTTKLMVDYFHYYAPTNVIFWTGAASAYWTNAANWVSNLPPVATSDLTFSYLSTANNTILGGDLAVDGLVVLEMANGLTIGGTNKLTLGAGGLDMVAANHNVTLNAPVNLAVNQTWSVGPNNPGNILTMNAGLSGNAALTKSCVGTLVLTGTNSFSGTLNVDSGASTNDGAVCITTSAAIAGVASPIFIRNPDKGVSTLQLSNATGGVMVSQNISLAGRNTNVAAIENLFGTNTLAGGITFAAGGSNYSLQWNAGTLNVNGSITAGNTVSGASTLVFQGAGNFLVSSSIQDGSSSTVGQLKTGSGRLTLSGASSNTGPTTVSGGTLAGTGSIGGAVTVQAGGTVASGTTNTLGSLTFGGSLTFATGSTNFMRINKALQTNDQLQIAGLLTYGGTLVVTNVGGTLASGDTFKLFNAGSYTGSFAGLILPSVPGYGWNTNGLTNGIISLAPTQPQIISDLPPSATRAVGAAYTYSIVANATPPFGYQWYSNSTLLPGQTNASYPAVSTAPGTYTYQVVVTNGYGATASSVSTLTVLPWPTSAYAAAVRNYQPAGYWPLQETNPPAPATVETNLGSLGPVANAYYLANYSSSVTLGMPGALAGDADTSVAFNSTSQPFAFVPRSTPALTLVPPFTIEAWFYPQSTVYGVILGEGGGASMNGGSTYGGFQFGWASSSLSRFDFQLYHKGINAFSNLATPSGYALNTWYHYVVTFNASSNATLYVNGQALVSGNLTYIADTWSPLTIGNGKWNGLSAQRAANGVIDEVAVYTNVLSSADILAHYSAGTNRAPATSYKQTVLNNRPLLYYRMDSPAYVTPDPTVAPLAVNYGTAPINGAYPSGTDAGNISGPTNAGLGSTPVALSGNGIFSCVDAGYDPAFNPTNTRPFTVLLWFKGDPADSSMQALMGHGNNSWSLNLNGATGGLVWNSGSGSVNPPAIYNDGAWHQAAGVFDGAHNYLYVDGSLTGSSTASGAIVGNTNHVYLGGDPDYTTLGVNERYFAGAIAQAAFFTSALTLQQIQATYQAAVAPPLPTLSISNQSGNHLVLSWSYGTLQSATNIHGPFQAVTNVSSPCTLLMTNAQQFYRVRE